MILYGRRRQNTKQHCQHHICTIHVHMHNACTYIYIYNIQALRAFRRAYLRATNIEERTSSSKETIIRAKLHITNYYYSASSEKPLQGGIKEAARRQSDWGGSRGKAPMRHKGCTEEAAGRQSDWVGGERQGGTKEAPRLHRGGGREAKRLWLAPLRSNYVTTNE